MRLNAATRQEPMRVNRAPISLQGSVLVVVFCALTSAVVSAQTVVANRPTLETVLIPGMTVWITGSDGREEKTRIVGVSGDVVTTSAGNSVQYLRATNIIR